ncbi:MAG: hypothetical protein SF029_21105 [bacterium]|nr:hypothetical protein [bacterium]
MELSLFTSLYRAEAFLPAYVAHVLRVGGEVQQSGIALELILVANDASAAERGQLEAFTEKAPFPVTVLHTPRETLYASWNRALTVAVGLTCAPWNVDDVRTSAALIEGVRRIQAGCKLVDFAYTLQTLVDGQEHRTDFPALPCDVPGANALERMRTGPFFMFARSLYETVGPFDERFRVCGDFEWNVRAQGKTVFCRSTVNGGIFSVHGGNLSAEPNNPSEAELNVVHLLFNDWTYLRPVAPTLMRSTWEHWKNHPLPAAVEDQLWGVQAKQTMRELERAQHRRNLRHDLMKTVRTSINPVLSSQTRQKLTSAARGVARPLYHRAREVLSRSDEAAARAQQAQQIEDLQLLVGGLHTRLHQTTTFMSLHEAEFKVFSQFGEDGIIQYLLRHVPIENPVFVEFGVGDYQESNTRFLLTHNNWRGLIIDGGTRHLDFIQHSRYQWRHQIDALSAFITRETINALIASRGIQGDIGLLSIDLDGIDYWILDVMEIVSPRILITEYNSAYGAEAAVTVPYQPDFFVTKAHPSNLYWGASLAAFCQLAERKGYRFVGSNSAGHNAFFVREDVLGDLPTPTVEQGYVQSRFSVSVDPQTGQFNRVFDHQQQLRIIADMPLVDVRHNRTATVREMFGLEQV